ncbi:MAG: hypothetical protein NTV68_01015 [Methanomicrobiales archaeon]|nr:hypothetical protein [Methanomicrobiales archaeon]
MLIPSFAHGHINAPPPDTINLDPGLTISFLNPTATFSDDINQNSIVLKMTSGSVSFLFMGDANADAETRMANSATNYQADILKVGHHGSATSSSSAFLSKVQPKISVIEVGPGIPIVTRHQRHWVAWPRWGPLCTAPT